ncbi:MAG TPA: polysaccharide biosynthesis/export family protein [Pyrinomonadaceae bacterium]|nr:polysaccharide biosynthesis/export family protein [Pyrinomonadaceae bacterium]
MAQEQSPGPVAGQTSSSIDTQGVRNYLLGPGDILDVRVFGQPDLNALVEIDGDGNISSLPFLETPIRAQCRTEKEVQKAIATAYSTYLKSPQVSVRIAERKSRQPATIYGAVRNPMQVTMMRRVRMHELIAKSGGVSERASGLIQLMHTEPEMCPEPGSVIQKTAAASQTNAQFEVYKLRDLNMGKEEADPYIRPGDIVIVAEGEPVYVTGAVIAPREVFMKEKLTLTRAIAMAGGPQRLAKTNEVHIYRQNDEKNGEQDLKYDYDAIRKGKEPDVLLKANDVIAVGNSGTFSRKGFAELLMNGFRATVPLATQRAIIY